MWKKKLHIVIWILLGGGTLFLLIAAMNNKNGLSCEKISIEFENKNVKNFTDKNEILNTLNENGAVVGKEAASFPIEALEIILEKSKWISNADLFFDKELTLHVRIQEPLPIARLFSVTGKSYYIDSNANLLSIPENIAIRVPVFTNLPDTKNKGFDSTLKEVVKLASYIQTDSFWHHQIAQIALLQNGNYELFPVVGNQLLRIGTTDNLEEKFSKLKLFYNEIWGKTGFEKYSIIDVRFNNQLVATRKDQSNLKPVSTIEKTDVKKLAIHPNNKKEIHSTKKKINQEVKKPVKVKTTRQPKAVMHKNEKQ